MDNEYAQRVVENARPIDEETEEIVDLAGFQVTKAELFAHSREPAITFKIDRMKFNMACIRRFSGVTHIQLLIHPQQKRIVIRPCKPEAPDALRRAKGSSDEMKNRDLICRVFAAKVFDLMEWNRNYRYKLLGKIATCENEVVFLFKLSDFELFVTEGKKNRAYLPDDWRDFFGTPVEKHEDAYKIDLAEGYITTDKA